MKPNSMREGIMEEFLVNLFSNTKLHLDDNSLLKISFIFTVMIAALIALFFLHRHIRSKADVGNDTRKKYAYKIVARVLSVIIIVIGVIAILQTIGINATRLSVILSIAIIILIMALKDSLQDTFASFVIVTDRYFTVGDAVEFDGKDGIVISFTVRSTKIELLDDRSVLSVSNRNISRIRKLTHLVDIDFPVPYEVSDEDACSLLSGICMKISALEGIESCELKGLQEFGPSFAIYKIRFFCKPNDRPDIRRAVLKTIRRNMTAAGLHIPYQQIDIHEK